MMLLGSPSEYRVICRIGSLEILTGKAPTKELVICRIGSLETVVPLNMR